MLVLRGEQKHEEAEVHFHSSAVARSLPLYYAAIAHARSFSPRLCFEFQLGLGVAQPGSYNNVIHHISSSPSSQLLKYVIGPVIKGSVCAGVNVPLAPL